MIYKTESPESVIPRNEVTCGSVTFTAFIIGKLVRIHVGGFRLMKLEIATSRISSQ